MRQLAALWVLAAVASGSGCTCIDLPEAETNAGGGGTEMPACSSAMPCPENPTECRVFDCVDGTCLEAIAPTGTACGNDAGFECTGNGVCKVALGAPCGDDGDCASSMCIDNVCCSAACDGTCEACDVAGAEGDCALVPLGDDPDDECGETACNGEGRCGGALTTSYFAGRAEDSMGRVEGIRFAVDDDDAFWTTVRTEGSVFVQSERVSTSILGLAFAEVTAGGNGFVDHTIAAPDMGTQFLAGATVLNSGARVASGYFTTPDLTTELFGIDASGSATVGFAARYTGEGAQTSAVAQVFDCPTCTIIPIDMVPVGVDDDLVVTGLLGGGEATFPGSCGTLNSFGLTTWLAKMTAQGCTQALMVSPDPDGQLINRAAASVGDTLYVAVHKVNGSALEIDAHVIDPFLGSAVVRYDQNLAVTGLALFRNAMINDMHVGPDGAVALITEAPIGGPATLETPQGDVFGTVDPAGVRDVQITVLEPSLAAVRSQATIGGPGVSLSSQTGSVHLDADGTVFFAATVRGNLTLGELTSNGASNEPIVGRVSSSGRFGWVQRLRGAPVAWARDLKLDQSGNVALMVVTENPGEAPLTFGAETIETTGHPGAFETLFLRIGR